MTLPYPSDWNTFLAFLHLCHRTTEGKCWLTVTGRMEEWVFATRDALRFDKDGDLAALGSGLMHVGIVTCSSKGDGVYSSVLLFKHKQSVG
jgi:hypothetical protein